MKTGQYTAVPRIIQQLRAWPLGVRAGLIAGLALMAVGLILILPPIPQPLSYHQFADQRAWLGLPHFLNVLSNIPLFALGSVGLQFLRQQNQILSSTGILSTAEKTAYQVFFLGALLTGIGSAYYHWAPDNAGLLWDRLPMTLCFMAFLIIALRGRITERTASLGLPPLLILGLFSVIHWYWGEQHGAGDLRLYGLVQFFPMLLIPCVLLLFPSRLTTDRDSIAVLMLYALAIACDHLLDGFIFSLGTIISGHSLKHLLAAFAVYWLLRSLRRRLPIL